jgi:zinc protease
MSARFRSIALAVACWASRMAWAGGELVLPPVERVTFDNGLRVIVAEYHEVPVVEFYMVIGAGAAQDPVGKEGVAALTAVALRRGAGSRSAEQLAETIEGLGAGLEAAGGVDGSIVQGEFLADDFQTGVGLLRDLLLAPTFAKDEVRRARDEQLAGIVAALEEPSAVAEQCFSAALYGAHAYGRPPAGRPATVKDLDHGDVRDFYERWYRPNNSVLVVVGDVSRDAAIATLRAALGEWKMRADAKPVRVPPNPSPGTPRFVLVDMPSATQAQIRLGGQSMARRDPDFTAAQVPNTMLGGGFTSKLIEELRVKRSLTYGASSGYAARLLGGDFRVSTFTKSATTVETIQLAQQVVGAFRAAAPDPKAFVKAKAYLRGQFPLKVETPEALAMRLGDIEVHGLPPDDLLTYRQRIDAVTPAEAMRVNQAKMPSIDAMTTVVVGKASEIQAPLEAAFGAVTVVAPDACAGLAGAR